MISAFCWSRFQRRLKCFLIYYYMLSVVIKCNIYIVYIFLRYDVKYDNAYLHMHKHIKVKIIMMTAATDAPTATAMTSPSISQ